jgi:hypothetical protein
MPGPGGPATLASMNIKSDVRTSNGAAVASLEIAMAPDGLSFTATATKGIATWPEGPAHWDIKFVYDGVVFYSETVSIDVQRAVTK